MDPPLGQRSSMVSAPTRTSPRTRVTRHITHTQNYTSPDSGKPADEIFPSCHPPPPPPPTHPNLNITQMGAAELRHAALLARRRARPARRRRELVAQLRRRSRDVLELPDPGPVLRSSLENGGGGGTEECRRAAGLVVRSKRTVGQRAEPRRRARWSAYDSPMMPSH